MTLKLRRMAKILMIFACFLYTPFVFSSTPHFVLVEDDESGDSGSNATGTYNGGGEEPQRTEHEAPAHESSGQGYQVQENNPPPEHHVQGHYGNTPPAATGYQVPNEQPAATGYQVHGHHPQPSTGYQVRGGNTQPAVGTGYQVHGNTQSSSTSFGFHVGPHHGAPIHTHYEYFYPTQTQVYVYEGYQWAPYYENKLPRGAIILSYTPDGRPVFQCSVKHHHRYYVGTSVAGGPCIVRVKGRIISSMVFGIRFK